MKDTCEKGYNILTNQRTSYIVYR